MTAHVQSQLEHASRSATLPPPTPHPPDDFWASTRLSNLEFWIPLPPPPSHTPTHPLSKRSELIMTQIITSVREGLTPSMKLDSSVGIPDFILPCGIPVAEIPTSPPPLPVWGAGRGGIPVDNVLILPAREMLAINVISFSWVIAGRSPTSARVATRGKSTEEPDGNSLPNVSARVFAGETNNTTIRQIINLEHK